MLHIKSATIKWPQEQGEWGVVFISKFRQSGREVPSLKEEEKDLQVKAWLEQAGGGQMCWVSLLDQFRITLGGIQPRHSNVKFGHISMEEILERSARPYHSRLVETVDLTS
jgi:hypothetical protein